MYLNYTRLIEKINYLRFDLTSTNSQLKKLQKRLDSLEDNLRKEK